MHVMEGYLPLMWCVIWYVLSIPVIIYGVIQIKKYSKKHEDAPLLLALSGAFMFILSSLKMPSVTGSCSHPCGNGLGTAFFGPAVTAVLATIVLVFQAVLLAHGGLTTLGANIFSMGIVGPVAGWLVWKACRKTSMNAAIAMFITAFVADLMTYVMTAIELGLAFPAPTFGSATVKFLGIFAITQLPLAIAEGILTAVIYNYIVKARPSILVKLNVIDESEIPKGAN